MVKTWRSVLAVLAITSAVLLAGAPSALAQDGGGGGGGGPDPTTASTAERVSAEVLPAVMYIQVDVRAWMRDMITGNAFAAPAMTFTCTGFAVSPNGLVATAGHCVDDQEVLLKVADTWAQEDAAAGYDYQARIADYLANWKLEGVVGNTPPDRTITVYRATSTANQAGTGMLAQVVEHKGYAQGDVALLKVDATNLPTVEVVSSDAVNTGTPIMAVGYPATRDEVVDPSLSPTWKDGAVSSRQNSNGVPFLEITGELGHGMSGGPTVNDQGQVVGINSRGATDDADSSNFAVPSSALLDMMARNGNRPDAGPIDVAYRTGLDDYFGGQYSDAADEFQQVLDLQPENKMASEYKSKALAAYNQFGDKGSLGLLGWLLVGGGALLVLVAGGVTLLLGSRSRKHRSGVGSRVYGATLPAPRTGEEPVHGPVQQFGAMPFGDHTPGPQSPAVGFPAPMPGSADATMTVAAGTWPGQDPAPAPTATMTPSDGLPVGGAAEAPSMGFCPNCGTPRTSGARFCGSCGHKV